MGKINILDFQVANLIAAGEVVDRPASVIKELLENSIDAEASVITVETKRGGSAFMRVTDNGIGMSRDDVPVCVKRHATSKIKDERDLDGILTLGFRGEALAAIAAVSKIRIMTKTRDSAMGTIMRCENGTVLEVNETGCPDGTTVIVEELFASVPARRKFLKRDLVETMAISAVVEKIALSHPEISMRLICDGTTKFASAGDGSLKNTVYSVLGREFASKLIEVDCLTEGVGVNGYIGSPDNVRGNRNLQNFFINGRFVKSKTIQAALEQAFESYIPSDRFPSCILYLQIHPSYVDVNVHPAKLEVKFSNEQTIFNAVYCAVRNALTHNVDRPKMRLGDKNSPDVEFASDVENNTSSLSSEAIKLQNAFVSIEERGGRPKQTELPELPEVVPEPSIPEPLTETEIRITEASPPEGLHMKSDGERPEIPDKPENQPLTREV
nr:DNA mismatch repair endonuclease MutL [Clostridia bacterium]